MKKELLIRNACVQDIKEIEALYRQRVLYNDAHNIHQWTTQEVTWEELSKLYTLANCFVGVYKQHIACVVMIVEEDELYWPLAQKGESLYLHKLCVHPNDAGNGFADQMIHYFKEKAKKEGYVSARLDVREHKKKLREMYEKNGFLLVRITNTHQVFLTALYEYTF